MISLLVQDCNYKVKASTIITINQSCKYFCGCFIRTLRFYNRVTLSCTEFSSLWPCIEKIKALIQTRLKMIMDFTI